MNIETTSFPWFSKSNDSKHNKDAVFGALFTLNLSIIMLNFQCKEGAEYASLFYFEILYFCLCQDLGCYGSARF